MCGRWFSDKAILFNNKKNNEHCFIFDPRERPFKFTNILVGEIDTLVEAAKYVDKNTEADIYRLKYGVSSTKNYKS